MNIETAASILSVYLDNDTPAFIWGAPGIGKSDITRQIAKERGIGLVDFRAILRDPVDLRGLPTVQGDTAKWLKPDDLPQVARDGEEGILFLDELNAAPPSMQAACFGLVLDRKVGDYHLPDGWRVVAAGNRQSDRAAAQRMPTALANRFAHIDVEPDVDAFVNYAIDHDMNPLMSAFIRFRPHLLHDMKADDLRAFPTPRSWAEASKYIDAAPSKRLMALQGIVGEGAAAEFEGFIQTYHSLPSIDQCIMDPDGARVPETDQVAARYAITAALAQRSTPQNFDNVNRYLRRLPREFHAMLMADACRRDVSLTHTKAFVQWAKDNADVTL